MLKRGTRIRVIYHGEMQLGFVTDDRERYIKITSDSGDVWFVIDLEEPDEDGVYRADDEMEFQPILRVVATR